MKLNNLKIVNFRNYERINLDLNDSLNIIYGNNGSGKTNLVEAIYTLGLTRSFRTKIDKNLIRKGELSTKIEGDVINNYSSTYQIVINNEGKKVKIDNQIIPKISDYISNINLILLQPDEQIIFDESPNVRRKMLNIEISQLNREYLNYLNNYNRILKQRNFYLRELFINGNSSRDYLNILTNNLIEYGLKINKMRCEFINNINKYLSTNYHNIFELGNLEIKYISNYSNKTSDEILKIYQKNYNREISLGKTLIGIHHDDIVFLLDGENIAYCGSNGQRKNAILSYKLSELEVFYNKKGTYPILILDDIFSALDSKKIENIIALLNKNVQTFITTTEIDKIDKKLLNNAMIIKINNGTIEEDNNG